MRPRCGVEHRTLFWPAIKSDPTGQLHPDGASSSALRNTCGSARYCLSYDELQCRHTTIQDMGRHCTDGYERANPTLPSVAVGRFPSSQFLPTRFGLARGTGRSHGLGFALESMRLFQGIRQEGEQVYYEVSDITGPSPHLWERPGLNASRLAVTTAQARDPRLATRLIELKRKVNDPSAQV